MKLFLCGIIIGAAIVLGLWQIHETRFVENESQERGTRFFAPREVPRARGDPSRHAPARFADDAPLGSHRRRYLAASPSVPPKPRRHAAMTTWTLERLTALLRHGGLDPSGDGSERRSFPENTPADPMAFIIPSTLNVEAIEGE